MSDMAFHLVFLGLVAVLLGVAYIRWNKTPAWDDEHAARGDMVRLLLAVLIGLVGATLRTRLPLGSVGFWICTLLLLPVAVVVLFYIRRLFGAYRQSNTPSKP